MPQVVVCSRCQQRFMAPDELLGTVVPCPACGSAISIPTVDPLAQQPLASVPSARTLPAANFSPSLSFDRQRTIILAVVGAICLVWLLLAVPNVLLWAAGRPAASLEKVGAGAVLFWIGVLAACGGLLEWSLFMNSRKMQVIRQWFGDRGAKWFYASVGGVVVLMGLGLTASATAYSLFGTSIDSPERPDFTNQPPQADPLGSPLVSAPPPPPPAAVVVAPPPADAALEPAAAPPPADAAPPPPAADVAQQPVTAVPPPARKEFSELPGTWRQLQGGYCIKVPAAVTIDRDTATNQGEQTRQDFGGSTAVAKPHGVNFAVHVSINPRNHELDTKVLFGLKQRQPLPHELSCELIVVNGLDVMKTTTKTTQAGALGRKVYTHHGTTYQFAEKHCTITLSVYSQLPLDHADQQAVREYLNTFQRLPVGATAPADPNEQVAGTWQPLEGGFRIRTSPAVEVRVNEVTRRGSDQNETAHHWHGQTADGVQFKVDVLYSPAWNHANEARKIAAARSERPRPDYEHVAVEVNGLVMQRITRLPRGNRTGPTFVEYKFLEGQHQIEMSATSKLALDHASFQTVVRLLESIERIAPQ